MRQAGPFVRVERVVEAPDPFGDGGEHIDQRIAIRQSVKLRHPIQPLAQWQLMGLAVVDHLHPMLDRAQQDIGIGQRRRLLRIDPPRLGQFRQRVTGGGRPQCGIASAWINWWICAKNSISRMPPRPRFRS